MDESMVFERIKALAKDCFSIADIEITADTSYTDLGLDSLDAYELLMAVEDTFEITLPEDNIDQISTMQDMVDMVMDRL